MSNLDAYREAGNPMFNDNKLKLGTFGTNCSNAQAMTTAETTFRPDWETNLRIAKQVEAAGIECMVPIARWKGFGGQIDLHGENLETYTWAAGLAAATENVYLFSTSHVTTIHPIVAAKQATTIDQISNGRIGLNIVSGWYRPEMEMFGAEMLDHSTRYDYAAEWLDVAEKLWSGKEFDHEGRFFKIKNGLQKLRPIQNPRPLLISAGSSKKGRDFSAKYCDINFSVIEEIESGTKWIKEYKDYAWQNYGREVGIFTACAVVVRDTEKEAKDYYNYYVREKGDLECCENFCRINSIETSNFSPELFQNFRDKIISGMGAYELVGTPEQIVEKLIELSSTGINGTLLQFVDYNTELPYWNEKVMPLLEQAGLRNPVKKQLPVR